MNPSSISVQDDDEGESNEDYTLNCESIVSSNKTTYDDNKITLLDEGEHYKMLNDILYDAVDEDVEVESEHLQSKPSKPINKATVITFKS